MRGSRLGRHDKVQLLELTCRCRGYGWVNEGDAVWKMRLPRIKRTRPSLCTRLARGHSGEFPSILLAKIMHHIELIQNQRRSRKTPFRCRLAATNAEESREGVDRLFGSKDRDA